MSGSGFSVSASRTSTTLPLTVWPAPCTSGPERSTPSTRATSRSTAVGSSMRRTPAGSGTTAAASSMSLWISPGTASAVARSGVSLMTRKPSGLSSRTTSPVSVTHDVEVMPAKRVRTLKAGTGRSATRTTSRASTSTTIVSLRRVAGSNTAVSTCLPEARPEAASWRERFSDRDGGSGSSRVSVRVPPLGVLTVSRRFRPSIVPEIWMGPVPGSIENWNDRA